MAKKRQDKGLTFE